MKEIIKKTNPDTFELILKGEQTADIRINDFIVKPDDIIVFKEYDPVRKKLTGRKVSKTVKAVRKFDPTEYYDLKEIAKKGLLLIELMPSTE